MSTIVTRAGKGSALTYAEVDSNFTNLNTDKYQSGSTASLASLTLASALPVLSGGTGTSTAFTPGSVVFAGASGVYSQDNANLFWDNTNNRLGIGTTAPAAALDLFTGKLTGSASDLSNRVSLNLGAGGTGGGFAAADFEYPAGGKFRAIEVPLVSVGVNDIFFQAYPPTTGGYGYFETWQGAGTIIGTGNATPIIFRPNRAEVMRLTSAGNLGIGTTTPGVKLDVVGAIRSNTTTYPNYQYNTANRMAFGETVVPAAETGSVVQFGSGSSARNMLFAFTKTGVNTSFFGNDGTQMMLGSEGAAPITFRTGLVYTAANIIASGAERMRITSAGDVGIGTTTPASKLEVSLGAEGEYLRVGGDNASNGRSLRFTSSTNDGSNGALHTINAASASGVIAFATGGTERMRVTGAGNVGIGTSTNLSTLTVNGSFASKSPSTVNAATYTVAATDGSLRFTTTNCTVTLPAPASFPGRILYLNTITANSVTSASANVIPLGSNTAGTAILAATLGKFAMIQSDGTNWITMMAN